MQPAVGIYGGSFDPVHNGHLHVARQLLASGRVGQVVFVPAALPPHKLHRRLASAADRLAMLRLALAGSPELALSEFELAHPGPSYTILTAEHFAAELGGERLRLILGLDSLPDLHRWYRGRELAERFRFLIFRRPGTPVPSLAELTAQFGPEPARRLFAGVIDGPGCDISSTAVREALAGEIDCAGLLPPVVHAYIKTRGLYRAAGQPDSNERWS